MRTYKLLLATITLAMLTACPGRRNRNNGAAPGVAVGQSSLLGCGVPSNSFRTLKSTLGNGSQLWLQVINQSDNQVLVYGELVIPDLLSFSGGIQGGQIRTCLNPTGPAQTIRRSAGFETLATSVDLNGGGVSIRLLGEDQYSNAVYFESRSAMGSVYVQIPSARYFNVLSLVAQ